MGHGGADAMFERVYTRPVRHYYDLFIEIAGLYEDVKEYEKALKYLRSKETTSVQKAS